MGLEMTDEEWMNHDSGVPSEDITDYLEECIVINKVKCLAALLKESEDQKKPGRYTKMTNKQKLFNIHQEIDQYLFGGDGNLTYIGKILTMREDGII